MLRLAVDQHPARGSPDLPPAGKPAGDRPTRSSWHCTARAAAAALLIAAAQPAAAIDLGEASVLSQQGQRLRVAIPFGSVPGERISPLAFTVAATSAPEGHTPPAPSEFTILKPQRRNLVVLQSAETVEAPRVRLLLRVAGGASAPVVYDLPIPPRTFAADAAR